MWRMALVKLRSGRPAIFQRQGKGGGKLKLLFTLLGSARISKRFRFYEDAAKTAARSFPHNFRKALAKALASAR